MKIAFFDTKRHDKLSFDSFNSSYGFSITYIESHLSPETVSLAKGHDAVCVFVNDKITKAVLEELQQNGIKLVALRCSGYSNVDIEEARSKSIAVVRVPSYSPHAVAEHTLGLMMCLNRKIHHAYNRTKENNFSIEGLLGFDMHAKTAGVIGCGQIGSVMCKILQGFGMKVLGYDLQNGCVERSGAIYADLPTIYKQSDIITLHCPLTPQTQHIINKESIALMKNGVMLINTGRGGLVDTTALIAGLKSKKIGLAGLDVYEEESDYFYKDLSLTVIPDDILERLLTFPNVLITSHQAFFTKEAINNIAKTTLDNIKQFVDKKPLVNLI